VRSNLIKQQDGQVTGRQRMSPESLQTIIVAVVAILLLFELTVLVGIALLVVRIRKPLEELIANARELLESRGTEPND
jgi:hypothetical protein